MKTLLGLALCGLVAMTTALNTADFLAIDEGVEENDLDLEVMEQLEKNGTVREQLSSLLSSDSVSSLKASRISDQPAAYQTVMRGKAAMFDRNSATNRAEPELSASLSLTSAKRLVATSLYYCPHRNYLLRWFPLYSGWVLTDICFVPWATRQAITYARCTRRTCRLNSPRTGRCRPSCFTRRRMLVFCFNFRQGQWRWRWVVRNLPQACRCSTC